mgnify:CR=1 FL=1
MITLEEITSYTSTSAAAVHTASMPLTQNPGDTLFAIVGWANGDVYSALVASSGPDTWTAFNTINSYVTAAPSALPVILTCTGVNSLEVTFEAATHATIMVFRLTSITGHNNLTYNAAGWNVPSDLADITYHRLLHAKASDYPLMVCQTTGAEVPSVPSGFTQIAQQVAVGSGGTTLTAYSGAFTFSPGNDYSDIVTITLPVSMYWNVLSIGFAEGIFINATVLDDLGNPAAGRNVVLIDRGTRDTLPYGIYSWEWSAGVQTSDVDGHVRWCISDPTKQYCLVALDDDTGTQYNALVFDRLSIG